MDFEHPSKAWHKQIFHCAWQKAHFPVHAIRPEAGGAKHAQQSHGESVCANMLIRPCFCWHYNNHVLAGKLEPGLWKASLANLSSSEQVYRIQLKQPCAYTTAFERQQHDLPPVVAVLTIVQVQAFSRSRAFEAHTIIVHQAILMKSVPLHTATATATASFSCAEPG